MTSSPSILLEHLSGTDARTIAVAGCSKNAGKTTAMNVLTGTWAGSVTGLMSIGIDGEDSDFWLGVPKPRISALPGTLFATARRALEAAVGDCSIVLDAGISTPLGELVIARTTGPAQVLLAGVRHKRDVAMVRDAMFRIGAARVVIDGAYQRLMSADPAISDGLILATGAILGPRPADVVERTVSFVERIRVPATQDALFLSAIELACSTGRAVAATADGRLVPAADEGCDAAVRTCAEFADTLVALAMPGAVPRGFADLLTSITGIHGSLALVVRDATRLFIQGPEFRRFHGRGHRIFGEKSVNLLAIAVNPIAVTGGGMSSAELTAALSEAIPDVPVFDFLKAASDGDHGSTNDTVPQGTRTFRS
ncbi:MAG TPA: hypothetical protein PKH54_03130 [Myxococcota bacterium]|nr:hypothetical protein [Myxococcota bacterium]HOC98910.1 hypothetical protein [Myxococcota bacterium]